MGYLLLEYHRCRRSPLLFALELSDLESDLDWDLGVLESLDLDLVQAQDLVQVLVAKVLALALLV
jgi:hypothetical protein